jgi:hypothetical protein
MGFGSVADDTFQSKKKIAETDLMVVSSTDESLLLPDGAAS